VNQIRFNTTLSPGSFEGTVRARKTELKSEQARSLPHGIRRFGVSKKTSTLSLNAFNMGEFQLSASETAQFVSWDAAFNLAFNVLLALAASRVLTLVFAKLAEASAPPLKLPAEQWDAMVRCTLKPAFAAPFSCRKSV
jgi:hypothetical protein